MPQEHITAIRERYGLPRRYLLTVGTIEPRKNLSRLLEALALLRRQGEDVRLVVVGQRGWLYHDFFASLEKYEPRNTVILPGFVPDEDLPAIYSGATLTVLASLYEGFGLPILESMVCGTPVVSSRTSSLPELGGDAVCYFDPQNVEEMATVIQKVWGDAGLRQKMRRQGFAQAARFSWDRTAEETMRVYESLGVQAF
jgi:glycosyltransferase involved in cell wall biosynthesis